MTTILQEQLTFNDAEITLTEGKDEKNQKSWYMEGIFIQGEKKNHNGRVYPKHEIERAVDSLNSRIQAGFPILGEVDHPANLQINLDRVSHVITDIRMDGSNGVGKLKIVPTQMGNLIKTLLDSGVKLGVSSRGTGEVDHSGNVRGFDIVTVDIVAQPSAPDAYPVALQESLQKYKSYDVLKDLGYAVQYDPVAEKYLLNEVKKFIQELKL